MRIYYIIEARTPGGHGIDAQAKRLGVSRRKMLATLASLLGRLPLTPGDMGRLRIGLDQAE